MEMDGRGKGLPNSVAESRIDDGRMEGKNIEEDDAEEMLWVDEHELLEDMKVVKKSNSRAEERMKWWKVYALHFLFMWNTRTYEYASVGPLHGTAQIEKVFILKSEAQFFLPSD